MAIKKKVTKKKTVKKKTTTKKKIAKKVLKEGSVDGRPTKFNADKLAHMKSLYEMGRTDKQVAAAVGVSHITLHNWKHSHPDFFSSLKDWKIQADKNVEVSLWQRANGYTAKEEKVFCDAKTGMLTTKMVDKHYPPDPTSMIFWLKNRQPQKWRDKREVEVEVGEETRGYAFKLDVNPDDLEK